MMKLKRFIALFLALILFCMSFPVSAFADSTVSIPLYNKRNAQVQFYDSSIVNYSLFSPGELPVTVDCDFYPPGVKKIVISTYFKADRVIPKGTKLTFSVGFNDNYFSTYDNGSIDNIVELMYISESNQPYISSFSVNFKSFNKWYGTITTDRTIEKGDIFLFSLENSTISVSSNANLNSKAFLQIDDFNCYYTDTSSTEQTNAIKNIGNNLSNWFSNLWNWLKDILDNIKAIPTKLTTEFTAIKNSLSTWFGNVTSSISTNFTNISNSLKTWFESVGEWFTNLSSSIGTFFSNLSDSLKEWFKNVGNWFSELGTNIGNFFTNLWENITGAITERVNAFHEWWDSLWSLPDGWSEEYKEKWNTWLSAHFGILVNSVEFIEYTFSLFTDWSQSDDLRIIIPKITIPVVDKVLLKRTSFDFNTFFDNEHFVYAFYLYDTVVSCICAYFVFTFARKTFFNMIDKNKRLED